MVTKVAKIEIKRPLDIEIKEFYRAMRELQYQCWRFANKAVTQLWDFQQFDFAYKQRFGEYFLKENEKLPSGYKQVKSDILKELKEEVSLLPGNCKDAMIRMVENKWKNDLKEILKGERTIPNFKRTLPIELHNKQFMDSKKNIRIFKENGKYSTIINLLSSEAAKKDYKLEDGNIHLELIVKKAYLTAIVDRVISGEYKLSMSKMQYDERKKKWFLLLTYSFDVQPEKLNTNKVLGVDLGVNIPAMCAVEDRWEYLAVGNGAEIARFENEVLRKRRELQRSTVWAGDGAIGHGRKRRIKRLEKIGHQIENFKKTKNHAFSRAIVDFAVRHNCGLIQLEDLSEIAEDNLMLKRWTYFQLQEMIRYKAAERGIQVVKIKSAYTSQRCNKCGYVHHNHTKESYRPTQEVFQCVNCAHKTNADLNAARNIAMKDIEQIITDQIKLQNKMGNHRTKYGNDSFEFEQEVLQFDDL